MLMQTRSSSIDPGARETQVVAFLDQLPRELAPILIGGYAVAAYGPPRFSVDVDLVLPVGSSADANEWFDANRVHHKRTLEFEGPAGKVTKLLIRRDLLSGDVYFGGLRARETGIVVDYEWIARSPRLQRLSLTTVITRNPILVARVEALWVLKLLAGRAQDLTDLFAISGWQFDHMEVRDKLEQLADKNTRAHFRRVRSRLDSEKEYKDALSRRGFGSPTATPNRAMWARFRRLTIELTSA